MSVIVLFSFFIIHYYYPAILEMAANSNINGKY